MTATIEPMLKAHNVHKAFGKNKILKGITLEGLPGEVMCLLGPSGSGKSTFLRCVNHLEKIDQGKIFVDGELIGGRIHNGKIYELREKEICRSRMKIGMVFQHFNLFPHMSVLDNVMYGLKMSGVDKASAAARAEAALRGVGLVGFDARLPSELSGGQQQRVALARSLVTRGLPRHPCMPVVKS